MGLVELSTGIRDWMLPMSGPERAVMELLNDVGPRGHSFDHAAHLFEGLTVLRPGLVNRQVVKGGRLDKRYRITVPESFGAESL